MKDIRIYRRRISQLRDRIADYRYTEKTPLKAEVITHPRNPIPYEKAISAKYRAINVGDVWAELWGCGWFRFTGTIPKHFAGKTVVALIDVGGEGCVFENGSPTIGLTHTADESEIKRRIPVSAKPGEKVTFLVEAGANTLFGKSGSDEYRLEEAELAVFNPDVWQLLLDIDVLINLAEQLSEDSPRFHKIMNGLNRVANGWKDGEGLKECRAITSKLLASKAHASATTAWSIGHAHIDLGWLWPVRETIRKGGRTFATVLRMMKEYPEYKFGASQPQLYYWMKETYPVLYKRIKKAIKEERWECQGAMWCEPDMNVTGGESLVRQCLYGKAFYHNEFGVEVDNLWLPDVFGYNAALPQILKKSDVNYFVTQKISWNETNIFPHHTFYWEGIDGTEILTHFLPTNNYNVKNTPVELINAEKRFAQKDVQDDFLNLYGIGDGGGGPSRKHIENGIRIQNCEGVPKLKFAFARDFLKKIAKTPRRDMPSWRGELYLELHRGTYTTQGKMKKYNRALELSLRDVEFLSVLSKVYAKDELDAIWRDTLLNQFHDILPGSSITWVYEDAHKESEQNLIALSKLQKKALTTMHPGAKKAPTKWAVYNSLNWCRKSLVTLECPSHKSVVAVDGEGNTLPSSPVPGGILVKVELPSMGYIAIELKNMTAQPGKSRLKASSELLENEKIRVKLAEDGTVSSLFDKQLKREMLSGPANKFVLWEDYPYSWDAWDISHYYRETEPEYAKLIDRRVIENSPLRVVVRQVLEIGNSRIEQDIVLEDEGRSVAFENKVDWDESHKLLRVQAECALQNAQATFEIQYGAVKRALHSNTSWERAQFEVAAHRFADLSQPDCGMALMNDCKYGYFVKDNILDLTLLRSPKNPDPVADIGSHTFTYAYLSHGGDFEHSDVFTQSHELNNPAIVAGTAKMPEVPQKSFFSAVDADGNEGTVKIETVKRAENGRGTIVRLYEPRGVNAQVTFNSLDGWKSITEVNLVERSVAKPKPKGSSIPLVFKPFEIRTFRLEQ